LGSARGRLRAKIENSQEGGKTSALSEVTGVANAINEVGDRRRHDREQDRDH
jgi:hypothetical protein